MPSWQLIIVASGRLLFFRVNELAELANRTAVDNCFGKTFWELHTTCLYLRGTQKLKNSLERYHVYRGILLG